jgi:hypothetical protein
MNNDEEIFTKHYIENKPISIEFDEKIISDNKLLIKKFKDNNLISESHHFNIEEDDNQDETKYFENVIEGTIKNRNLYCSYLDYFDKMWMGNKVSKSIFF